MEAIRQQLAERGLKVDDNAARLLADLSERGEFDVVASHEGQFEYVSWQHSSVPSRRTTAIVMSRPGRQLDRKDALFRVLRIAVSQLNPDTQSVLTVEGTASHPFVSRACELFGIPTRRIRCVTQGTRFNVWLKRIADSEDDGCHVFELNRKTSGPQLRDHLEVSTSDQLLMTHCRKAGNLHQLVEQRLLSRRNAGMSAKVFLALGEDQLVAGPVAGGLMDLGAIGWLPLSDRAEACPLASETTRPSAPVLHSIENQSGFLTHCTRRADGPWPDQTDTDYLDELILGDVTDRSSLAALIRILTMQRLLATNTSVRGETAVVSFTAATLDELKEMRTFRSHRGRWDFEPYGISIDREFLRSNGARQVIYGDETVWSGMPEADRPFFQKVDVDSIDWTIEREWRVIGDVDLSKVPNDKGIVSVPSEDEASHVARISRWPVIVR